MNEEEVEIVVTEEKMMRQPASSVSRAPRLF